MKRVLTLTGAVLVCATAVGVVLGGVDVTTWNTARKKFLRGHDEREKLPELIDDLGSLNDKRAVELLCKKTLFHEDFEIRIQTFEVLANTSDAAAVKYLAEQVRRSKKGRLIYTRLLKHISGEGVVENINRALTDKRWEVVSAALEAAREHPDEKLQRALKQKLRDKNPRLAYEAALAYEACGGELPEKFDVKEKEGIFPAKIFSARCVVLFDISDEMEVGMTLPAHEVKAERTRLKRTPKDYEKHFVKTRKEYCAEATVSALATLERGSEANVLIYSIGSRFWQRKFKKLSSRDIKDIGRFLERRMTQPARDLFGALREAMSVEGIDTIYVIACGLPAGARVEDTDYILSWLEAQNYERCVRINTAVILSDYMGGKPTDEDRLAYKKKNAPIIEFYKRIAARNAGRFRSLTILGKVPVTGATPEPKKEKPRRRKPKKVVSKEPEPKKGEAPKEEPKKAQPASQEPGKPEPKKEEPKKKPKKKDWLGG